MKKGLIILLLSGKSGSGKDTFFEFVKERFSHEINVFRFSFADEVKRIATLIGWNGIKDKKGIDLLQKISYAAREYENTIWTRKIVPAIIELKQSSGCNLLIVTDCRYKDQISFIKKIHNSIYVIRIERENRSLLSSDQQKHPSETSLDDCYNFDAIIYNTSMKHFHDQITKLIKTITNEKL